MKICLACSAGGHLTELRLLLPAFKGHETFLITFRERNTAELAEKEKVYFVEDTKRNPLTVIKSFIQSFNIIRRERPDIVVTTGAGVAIAPCIFTKLFGGKIIFLETMNRVTQPTIAGKILYPIADLFIVQWKSIAPMFGKKAVYGGQIV